MKSVFGGEMRETSDEESAIRVPNNFWVAKGVICKIKMQDFISIAQPLTVIHQ